MISKNRGAADFGVCRVPCGTDPARGRECVRFYR